MLYEDSSVKNTRVKYEGSPAAESAKGPTAIEFAYMIKTTEELGRDCDDAERILDVIYDTFFKMCEFRASGEELNDRFIKVYTQQLYKVYTSIAGSTAIYKTGTNAAENFKVFVDWLNNAGVFKDVARVAAIDGYGKVRITQNFNYTEVNDDNNNVRTVLKYITENAKAGK
jgi:hypothetical protein